jgi:multiple sugar transport system permease protein
LGGGNDYANEAIRMAATLLIIAPLVVAYFILQRLFIEGIDRSGITGE